MITISGGFCNFNLHNLAEFLTVGYLYIFYFWRNLIFCMLSLSLGLWTKYCKFNFKTFTFSDFNLIRDSEKLLNRERNVCLILHDLDILPVNKMRFFFSFTNFYAVVNSFQFSFLLTIMEFFPANSFCKEFRAIFGSIYFAMNLFQT